MFERKLALPRGLFGTAATRRKARDGEKRMFRRQLVFGFTRSATALENTSRSYAREAQPTDILHHHREIQGYHGRPRDDPLAN